MKQRDSVKADLRLSHYRERNLPAHEGPSEPDPLPPGADARRGPILIRAHLRLRVPGVWRAVRGVRVDGRGSTLPGLRQTGPRRLFSPIAAAPKTGLRGGDARRSNNLRCSRDERLREGFAVKREARRQSGPEL